MVIRFGSVSADRKRLKSANSGRLYRAIWPKTTGAAGEGGVDSCRSARRSDRSTTWSSWSPFPNRVGSGHHSPIP